MIDMSYVQSDTVQIQFVKYYPAQGEMIRPDVQAAVVFTKILGTGALPPGITEFNISARPVELPRWEQLCPVLK